MQFYLDKNSQETLSLKALVARDYIDGIMPNKLELSITIAPDVSIDLVDDLITFDELATTALIKHKIEFVLQENSTLSYHSKIVPTFQEQDNASVEGGFYSTSPFKRNLVCLAGPAMNLIFGFLIYCIIFVTGRPALSDDHTTVIGVVLPQSPAQEAGIQPGDKILAINESAVSNWKEVINDIALSSRESLALKIDRQGQMMELTAIPRMDKEKGLRLIGISRMETLKAGEIGKDSPAEKAGLEKGDVILKFAGQRLYQWQAFINGVNTNKDRTVELLIHRNGQEVSIQFQIPAAWEDKDTLEFLGITVDYDVIYEYPNPFHEVIRDIKNIFETLSALFAQTVSPKGLARPVGIIVLMGAFAKAGFVFFLGLIALISINLGVFNLLPIPVLDGGHMLFNTIEIIRRKALQKKTMILVQNVFVTILISFILFVTYQDLVRLGSSLFKGKPAVEEAAESK